MVSFFTFDAQNKKYLLPLILLFISVNLFWAFYSNATWDDDCPTRFFNMLDAFHHPEQFVKIWNRPLFMLIFTIPAQFGHWTVIVIQTILSVISGVALVKAAKNLKLRHAFLAFPFLVFQPFVFGVSRYAMTEPVAILLICLSIYFLTEKKWKAFAILGGLLPLARLELAILAPFWLIPLLQNKQYKLLIPMALPMISWVLIGGFINGNLQWFFKQTIAKESQENRYGHQAIESYIERYQYVIGPVLFFFATIGIPKVIKNKFLKINLLFPFLIGIATYSIFSSVLNMGNSAGFLRNLIPLSPYVTLMALVGINYWLNISRKNIYIPEKGKQVFLRKWKPIVTKNINTQTKAKQTILGLGIISVIITCVFFVFKLESHHSISDTSIDYFLIASQVMLLGLLFLRFKLKGKTSLFVLSSLLLLCSHTLITEHPLANDNTERAIVNKVAKFYKTANLDENITYANHPWFFWSAGKTPHEESIKRVTQNNLNNAQIGEIAIVENHYSNRLGGDIDMNFFTKHKEWVEVSSFNTPEKDFFISIYQKSGSKYTKLSILNNYIKHSQRKDGSALLLKGLYYLNKEKDSKAAISIIKEAALIEPELYKIPLTLGKISMREKDLKNALKYLEDVLKIDTENLEAHERAGTIYFGMNKFKKASEHYAFIEKKMHPTKVEQKPSRIFITSKRNLAVCQFRLKDYTLAFKNFNGIVALGKDKAEDHYNIGMIYLIGKKKKSACKALGQAYEMGMTSARKELDKYCK
jgi:tetratricopeptide (TPR) repeat protein